MLKLLQIISYVMLFLVAFFISGVLFIGLQPDANEYFGLVVAIPAGAVFVILAQQVVKRI